jgi:mannitol/fructose-specific phosphotransferase system IIA component (Ntr-type)
MVYLKDYIRRERILIADFARRQEAIESLLDLSRSESLFRDFDRFRQEIRSRETVVSTGIGQGVAIPHAKSASVVQFFITVGVFPKGVEWESLDRKPVQIAFLIGGPEDHAQYLQILAKLALIIRNPKKRHAIVKARTPDEVLAQFSEI